MTPTYAVIPTYNRPQVLQNCLDSIKGQVDATFVINNGNSEISVDMPDCSIVTIGLRPPNIQILWNVGLMLATHAAVTNGEAEHNVLVLNDDVLCPPNLVETLNRGLRGSSEVLTEGYKPVLAYPDQFGGSDYILHLNPEPVDLQTRITGYAYMLRGETGTMLDERFGWWYGDDDLDWRCRVAGGSLLVPGCAVTHLYPNQLTNANPELLAQTTLDRLAFIDKWGKAPH